MQFCHCIINTIQPDNVMSIFRETFTPEVKGQLRARQNAAQRKKPTDIIYQNSRNSWVRMTSSVNVKGKSDLAKSYVLQGGTLNDRLDYSLRSGVGTSDKAYSNFSPSLNSNFGLPVPFVGFAFFIVSLNPPFDVLIFAPWAHCYKTLAIFKVYI